jgi:hypothetical protein
MVIDQKDMKTESIDGHQAESRSLVIRPPSVMSLPFDIVYPWSVFGAPIG